MKNTAYRTQADAKRDIVGAIWGDVSFAKREWVRGDLINGYPETVVSANVNGRLVTFTFDQYGRAAAHRPPIVGDKTGA